jgi:SAM-dependent methyltransferase
MLRRPPLPSLDQVRQDFDRIARLGGPSGDVDSDWSARFLAPLLAGLPARVGSVLDLGCGAGALSRVMAARAERVLGVDLSPAMIERARADSAGVPNVEYRSGDLMTEPPARERFDVVVSVAALHHLPIAPALVRAASLVAPGGWLLIVDLFQPAGIGGLAYLARSWAHAHCAAPARVRLDPALGRTWREHGARDHYPTLRELRRALAALPGARPHVHLHWRWSLAWRAPRATGTTA